MDAVVVIVFYAVVVALAVRVRRFSLAATALALTVVLALALIVQATVAHRAGAILAAGMLIAVVALASAEKIAAWLGRD